MAHNATAAALHPAPTSAPMGLGGKPLAPRPGTLLRAVDPRSLDPRSSDLREARHEPAPRDVVSRAADAGVTLGGPLDAGSLHVDLAGYVVTVAGQAVTLSPRQVELLALFLAAPRKVWSRDQLNWICWGDTTPSRRVDVQLCRLRSKTGLDLFRNVRDRGWALKPVA